MSSSVAHFVLIPATTRVHRTRQVAVAVTERVQGELDGVESARIPTHKFVVTGRYQLRWGKLG